MEKLLDGVEGQGSSEKWTELTRNGFGKTGEAGSWSAYINQPYSAPPNFNIDHLIKIASSRLAEADDHFWLLQTEPAYLHYTLKSIQQARPVQKFETRRKADAPIHVSSRVTQEPVYRVLGWQWILEECENARKRISESPRQYTYWRTSTPSVRSRYRLSRADAV